MANKDEISDWFDRAKQGGSTHLIVVCDTFDHEDYPVNVDKIEDFWVKYKLYNKPENMSRIMEIYDMNLPKDEQMQEPQAWHAPPQEDTGAAS